MNRSNGNGHGHGNGNANANGAGVPRCRYCAAPLVEARLRCRACGEYQDERLAPRRGFCKRLFRTRPQPGEFGLVPVKDIRSNPYQPREEVDLTTPEFERLKQSVANYGVIVPVLLRRDGRHYQLVAGQRRVAACKAVGVRRVPAVVYDLTPREMMEVAYLENFHRKDLNALEDIHAFLRLADLDDSGSWRETAARFGRDIREIQARRDLLDLPVLLQEAVARRVITEAQARAIAEVSRKFTLRSLVRAAHRHGWKPDQIRSLLGEGGEKG